MAIDDNTSYELTGYQVKDLAQKIRAKADSTSLASVATSGLYSDLTGAPTIPTVYNGALTITQGGTTLGTFTANSSSNVTVDIPASSGGAGVFYLNHSIEAYGSNFTLPTIYKDAALTETATMLEMYNAFRSGGAVLVWDDGADPYGYPQKHVYTLASAYYDTDDDGDWIRFNVLAYCYQTPTGTWRDGDVFEIELDGGISDTTFYYRNANPMSPSVPIFHAANNTDLFSGSAVTFYKGENGTTETASMLDICQAAQSKGAIIRVLGTNPAYSMSYYSVINACHMQDSNGSYYKFELVELTNGRTLASPKIALFMSTSGSATTITPTILTLPTEAFTGATSSVAGTAGLVPAPTTSDPDKFLKGDGTWATVPAGETTTVFYWNGTAMYKDSGLSTAATMSDVGTAASAGPVKIYFTLRGIYEYLVTDKISAEGYFSTVWSDVHGNLKSVAYTYPSDTWDRTSINVQRQLTASTGISIDSSDNISVSAMTGATSQDAGTSGAVPAPTAGDQDKALKGDGTWGDFSEEFVIMKYGEANAWAKFIDAYNKKKIVYCRASSNSNPATGSQTRLAFMAYVSNETTPTNVEFQYVRSVGTKTSSQPVDQVFVYKLESTNGGTWSVQTRDMAPKIAAGTGINVSYSNGTYTISLA